ncbi:hypothetical protein [Peribacillus deserti]|uniref:hypothetical protein n=1 Tax=Peribacillus deserti TaxID=673318 RepID=UPI001156E84B|nr:hypothetical protein [Peribacillus deserti]
MEAQLIPKTTQKNKGKSISIFVKSNIAIFFLIGSLVINFPSWDGEVWLIVVMIALGFEIFALLLMVIEKMKPKKNTNRKGGPQCLFFRNCSAKRKWKMRSSSKRSF